MNGPSTEIELRTYAELILAKIYSICKGDSVHIRNLSSRLVPTLVVQKEITKLIVLCAICSDTLGTTNPFSQLLNN